MSANLHDGHRKRMRERFLKYGLEGFQEHEMLEMLLFYAIPRVNTNELAHRLIDRFGSLYGVVTADISLLREVKGVTENAAVLLKLMPALYQNCTTDPAQQQLIYTYEASCAYFEKLYRFETEEVLRVACLDDMLHLKKCVVVKNGSLTKVEATLIEIIRCCVLADCRCFILAHNHPGQTCKASRQDIASTHMLFERLNTLSFEMLDHIIVGRDGALSMRKAGSFHFETFARK